ncbi:MAG: response regulator [Silvibacterium sp.]|nr:response regulator [Silvibacterium sp.]
MQGKRPRILCLDDQPANLLVRKLLLEQFGCEVVAVHDSQSCLRAATQEYFDLALLDYHLAEQLTGADVARDLRIMMPAMRLVMLTGDPMLPQSAVQSVDAVLTKGTSGPQQLFQIIEDLLPDCALKPRREWLLPISHFGPPTKPPL